MKLFKRELNGRFTSLKSWWGRFTAHRGLIKLFFMIGLVFSFTAGYNYWKLKTSLVNDASAQTVVEYQHVSIEPMPQNVLDTINYYADRFAVEPRLALAIVNCESQNDPTRIGDRQADIVSIGLWQFQSTTFYQYAKKYKVKNANVYDYRDQTLIAIQMLRDGLKNEWTCGRKIK